MPRVKTKGKNNKIMIIEITDDNFEQLVVESGKAALIDFWAEWCAPCRMVSPVIEELSETYSDNVIIGKVNVDDNPNITGKYGIRSIPTLLFFKDGEVVDKHLGAASKNAIENKLRQIL